MSVLHVCRKCGHRLAERNTSGVCYRPCKPRAVAVPPTEVSPPSGVVRKLLLQLTCDFFAISEDQLVSNAIKGRTCSRARNIASYLMVHDLKLSPTNAGKVLARDGTFVKQSIDVVLRNMDEYRHEITLLRTQLEHKLDEYKPKAA